MLSSSSIGCVHQCKGLVWNHQFGSSSFQEVNSSLSNHQLSGGLGLGVGPCEIFTFLVSISIDYHCSGLY